MYFVDDIHLEAPAGRRIQRAFQQFAHVVHLRVGRCIQFDQIDETPAVDFRAGAAHAAWNGSNAINAIQGFGKDACDGGFAHAARAGEQVSMMQTVLRQRIAQSLHDMLLPRQLREGFGAPFAR